MTSKTVMLTSVTSETRHAFHCGNDVAADTYRQFVECDAVLGDNADVDGGLFLAYLHRHALGHG